MRTARNFQGSATDDYVATIDNVPPGEYVISIMAFLDAPGEMKESVAGYSSVVTVPTDPPTGTIDAGEILLQKPALAQSK